MATDAIAASRTYEDAISKLNSLQSNAATLEALRQSGGRMSEFAIPEMVEYLERIGYTTQDLNKLNVIHVTGTKGKGSTCAFCDSILRHTNPTWKTGLYTSPHIVAVRERIRINGAPISEQDFAKYFFEVWDRLEVNKTRKFESTTEKPMYFRFLTLVAFHAFLEQKVDATILEVGVGGTYDSTNIVPKPVVTGVSALGLDHVNVLGKTVREIGLQKGGIFKEGVPAFTVQQPEEGMESLQQQAIDQKASSFTVIQPSPELDSIKLGLAGAHQAQNANLAISLAHSFLSQRDPDNHPPPPPSSTSSSLPTPLPSSFIAGLENARWPGRCQQLQDPHNQNLSWFLDGAHTIESLSCCMEWYVSPGVGLPASKITVAGTDNSEARARILIFNCTSGRSGASFLHTMKDVIASQIAKTGSLLSAEKFFDRVIFCPAITYADGSFKSDLSSVLITPTELTVQQELKKSWLSLVPDFPPSNVDVLPTIQHALQRVKEVSDESGKKVDVLVTGSLHLVGGVIEVAGLGEQALRV